MLRAIEIGSWVMYMPRPRSSGWVKLKLNLEFNCGLKVENALLVEVLVSVKLHVVLRAGLQRLACSCSVSGCVKRDSSVAAPASRLLDGVLVRAVLKRGDAPADRRSRTRAVMAFAAELDVQLLDGDVGVVRHHQIQIVLQRQLQLVRPTT